MLSIFLFFFILCRVVSFRFIIAIHIKKLDEYLVALLIIR